MREDDWWKDTPEPPGRAEAMQATAAKIEAKRLEKLAKELKLSQKKTRRG